MSNNPFDTLGMYDDELAGIFSKVKKAVKKVAKKAEKVVTKARDKALPSKVAKELSRAAKNPIVRGAAAAVAVSVGAPMVANALGKTVAAKAITAKSVATTAAKGATKALVKKEVGKKVQSHMVARAKKDLVKIQQRGVTTPAAATKVAANINAIARSPELNEVVARMKSAGASDAEIARVWAQSNNYKAVATHSAAQTVYPQIVKQLEDSGMPAPQAQDAARSVALEVGAEAAEKVSESAAGKDTLLKVAAIGIPLAFAAFGG